MFVKLWLLLVSGNFMTDALGAKFCFKLPDVSQYTYFALGTSSSEAQSIHIHAIDAQELYSNRSNYEDRTTSA